LALSCGLTGFSYSGVICGMVPPPARSALSPYTTLFRSGEDGPGPVRQEAVVPGQVGEAGLLAVDPGQDAEHGEPADEDERGDRRSEEHTSELQSRENLVCRLLLEKKKRRKTNIVHRQTL